MTGFARRFLHDQRGATAVEYGLIAALISLVVFGAMSIVFHSVGTSFNLVGNTLQNATPAS